MRWLPLAAVVLLGCPTTPLNTTTTDPLRVEGSLEFGGVYVGASRRLTLTVDNPSRVARTVELTALGSPFAAPGTLTLGGGESLELEVTFTPLAAGVSEATLTVDETQVQVRGEGLAPLACPVPDPCSSAHFDAASGVCVIAPLPEDSACAAPCVTDGRCRAGTCVGAFDACDDSDPCTTDGCNPVSGCLHVAARCAPADDPCQASLCDRQTGCGLAPVPDGVHCGPDDCVRGTTEVCVNGRCVERARPAGQLCFETLAGVSGGPGHVDGRGEDARFYSSRVFTVDRFGSVIVFDALGVRRVTRGGVVSTIVVSDATAQLRDGVGSAGFVRVTGASADAWGNVLFIDSYSSCVRELSPQGAVSTLACQLSSVTAVQRTLDRRVWIASEGNLMELLPDGTPVLVQRLTNSGARRLGGATASSLYVIGNGLFALPLDGGAPLALALPFEALYVSAIDEFGVVYSRVVPDAGCEHGLVRFDGGVEPRFLSPPQGPNTCIEVMDNVSTFTGARVLTLAAADDESLWVMDRGTLLVEYSNGVRREVAGKPDRAGTADGFGADAGLNVTAGFGLTRVVHDSICVLERGDVVLSDSRGGTLRTWDDDAGLRTLVRDTVGSVNGLSRAADGGVWVAGYHRPDDGGTNLGLHRFQPESVQFEFIAPLSPSPDSGWSEASFLKSESQTAVKFDGSGAVQLHRYGFLLRYDGQLQNDLFFESQNTPLLDGTIPDAGLDAPRAPVYLAGGDLAFIDGNAVRRLSGGTLSTIAGSSDLGYVDSPGSLARFNRPLALAVHPNGELIVADTDNHAIRAISPMGLVRTVGRLTDRPAGVTVAPNGDIYVLVRHALLRGR